MKSSLFHRLKFDFVLAGLLVLLAVMNLPLVTGRTQIYWDTFNFPYEMFSIFYNEVYYHAQFPLWMPYSFYGLPDYLTLASLSIVNFFFIGLGKLLNIQNIFLLFKVSLVAEQAVTLTGMYLLARQLYKKKWVVAVVCLSLMATFVLYRQLHFNFRTVYLLPYLLLWMVLYFRRQRPEYLWLAGLTAIFSIPGTAYYPMIPVFYAVLIFSIVLLAYNPGIIRTIFQPTKTNLLLFLGFIAIGLLFIYYLRFYDDGLNIARGGRTEDLTVPLEQYMNFWRIISPLDLIITLLTGVVSPSITFAYEYSFYIGLLPVFGVIVALLHPRRSFLLASLFAAIALYLYSLRGFFSVTAYFFPMVSLTRYVAALGSVPFRTFLILIAGFGLDELITKRMIKKASAVLLAIVIGVDVITAIIRTANPASHAGSVRIFLTGIEYIADFQVLAQRIFAYTGVAVFVLLSFYLAKRQSDKAHYFSTARRLILVAVLIFDLALYRSVFEGKIQNVQPVPPPITDQITSVSPLTFQAKRFENPRDNLTRRRLEFAAPLQASTAYATDAFIQFDGCVPYFISKKDTHRYEMVSSSVGTLIDAGLIFTDTVDVKPPLKQIYACESPKLKVVSNVSVAGSDSDAIAAIQKENNVSNLLILSQQQSSVTSDLGNAPIDANIRVVAFDTDRLKLEVDIPGEKGGWLVYSDAYHPYWSATINGKHEKIERAYLAFKAVQLPAGKSEVEFKYGPWLHQLVYGAIIVLCGLAGSLALFGILVILFYPVRPTTHEELVDDSSNDAP